MTRSLRQTITFYPTTAVFLAGVTASAMVSVGAGLVPALVFLSVATVLVILWSISREVQIVHQLMNDQLDESCELLLRINDIETFLHPSDDALSTDRKTDKKG